MMLESQIPELREYNSHTTPHLNTTLHRLCKQCACFLHSKSGQNTLRTSSCSCQGWVAQVMCIRCLVMIYRMVQGLLPFLQIKYFLPHHTTTHGLSIAHTPQWKPAMYRVSSITLSKKLHGFLIHALVSSWSPVCTVCLMNVSDFFTFIESSHGNVVCHSAQARKCKNLSWMSMASGALVIRKWRRTNIFNPHDGMSPLLMMCSHRLFTIVWTTEQKCGDSKDSFSSFVSFPPTSSRAVVW